MISYNERSWAIDIISEINIYCEKVKKTIKRAGGENGIKSEKNSLFPDVLLFGIDGGGGILQGWELKMPDTPITDIEFIDNATKKARILGLNSFLLWNASQATLYIINDKGLFEPKQSWDDIGEIKNREDVRNNRAVWKSTLHKILDELNGFFEKGEIKKVSFIETLTNDNIIDYFLSGIEGISHQIKVEISKDAILDAYINEWWDNVSFEYPNENRWDILSKQVIISWINKFVFSHILKKYRSEAGEIEKIGEESNVKDAINIFNIITTKCDFRNIFQPQIGESCITESTWHQLIEFNGLLKEVQFENLSQETIQQFLEKTMFVNKRKLAGQYATPTMLAELLSRLTIIDKTKSVYDPCCGTGTITRVVHQIKREIGQTSKEASETVWASDKYSFPIQIATLAMSSPDNPDMLNLFQRDIFDSSIGDEIELHEPFTGGTVKVLLPEFGFITSNLPFVQQEDVEADIEKLLNELKDTYGIQDNLSKKCDLSGYILLYLWRLVEEGGQVGVIVSNSWLGTEWGNDLRKILLRFFEIKTIITSGKGRWFQNAQVITNIIILKKKAINSANESDEVDFVSLNENLRETNNEQIKTISNQILLKKADSPSFVITKYSLNDIKKYEALGMQWNAYFTDISWILNMEDKLIKASIFFDINRGERRGWDKMFYPEVGNKIEENYIKPVLKSATDISGFIASPDAIGFCCSKSIKDLKKLGHTGALSWIDKFVSGKNEKGEPLPDVLKRGGCERYEMKDNTLADFVLSLNPDKRLFIAKMSYRSFVNQRLIRFTSKNDKLDYDLFHALFNNILNLFYIESLGFGRGLGVLDLNTTKIKENLYILNPNLLDKSQIQEIKKRFNILKKREPKNLLEELEMSDRQAFDNYLLECFGLLGYKEKIIKSLIALYSIRKAIEE